jgi:hypothetical protein
LRVGLILGTLDNSLQPTQIELARVQSIEIRGLQQLEQRQRGGIELARRAEP